jgi:hypothetical protein
VKNWKLVMKIGMLSQFFAVVVVVEVLDFVLTVSRA